MNSTDLIINLKPSKTYFIFLLITTVLTTIIIFCLPITLIYQLMLLAFALGYMGNTFWQEYKNPIIKLIYDNKGWKLMDEKKTHEAELCGDSTLTAFVSVLRFKVAGQKLKRSCIIFQDSVEKDEYKKLLVAVRYMCRTEPKKVI